MIPFDGIPLFCQLLLMVAFVVIVGDVRLDGRLFVRGQRAIARAPEASERADDAWTWVFLVAALNEEITIGDSVERLLALELAHRKIIVIDDGSDDLDARDPRGHRPPRPDRAAPRPAERPQGQGRRP